MNAITPPPPTGEAYRVRNPPSTPYGVIRGQHHEFMLIPIMTHHAQWFEAGLITFAVEGRVVGDKENHVIERGATIHVFNHDRSVEYARFDCFSPTPHYHYILDDLQHNILWGYDEQMNGPMLPWAIRNIRERLPEILVGAGAAEMAERIRKEGFDVSILDAVEDAMVTAHANTFEVGTAALEEARNWTIRWKTMHPQFLAGIDIAAF